MLFLKAVSVREYFCMAVDGRLEVLCFARTPRATRASCATSSRPSGLVALDLAQSCQHYVVRGFALSREPRKLQQSVAEVGKRPSIPRAAARCHRMFFLCFFFFFSHTPTFQLLDKPRSQVSSLLPPVLAFNFYRA